MRYWTKITNNNEKTDYLLHLAGALMEHFLEGIAPLRHWYINPNEKSNTYKSSLLSKPTKALTEYFPQGNVPLRLLLNAKPPFMSWQEILLQWSKRLGPIYINRTQVLFVTYFWLLHFFFQNRYAAHTHYLNHDLIHMQNWAEFLFQYLSR